MSEDRPTPPESAPRHQGMSFRGRLLTCGGLLLIPVIIAGIIGAYHFYQWTFGMGHSLDGVVAPVLDGMSSGDYESVAKHMGATDEDLDHATAACRVLGDHVTSILGECRSRKLVKVTRQREKSEQKIELGYEAAYEKDVVRVDVELKKRDGEWHVIRFTYFSPLLENTWDRIEWPDSMGMPADEGVSSPD
jgi:hypothetical protein